MLLMYGDAFPSLKRLCQRAVIFLFLWRWDVFKLRSHLNDWKVSQECQCAGIRIFGSFGKEGHWGVNAMPNSILDRFRL